MIEYGEHPCYRRARVAALSSLSLNRTRTEYLAWVTRHGDDAVRVRLHGRNYKEWFTSNEDPGQRYNYLSRLEELDPWVERIRNIAQQSKATFVITNNHARGKTVANGLQLIALVTGRTVQAPESLRNEYSDLAEITVPMDSPPTQPLPHFEKPGHLS